MKHVLSLFLLCLAASTRGQQIAPVYAAQLQHLLDSACSVGHIKGVSASVYRPGEGYWTGTYGESHQGTPIDKNMYFPIGSNTKTFVAAALFKLQENGQVDMNDTIGQWINHSNVNGKITIRQLLNHTSGLSDYMTNYDFILAWNNDFQHVWQPEDMYQFIKPPVNSPGVVWNYSNTNYLLAGIIISKITNKPLAQALRHLVLTPAGLSQTFLYPHEQINGDIPHGWSNGVTGPNLDDMYTAIGYRNTAFLSMAAGAGGLVATASDITAFWNKLMTGQIISMNSVNEMKQLVSLPGADPYGMGMYSWPAHGHTIYNHPGTFFAFLNENLYDADNGICIAVLTNQDSVDNNYLFVDVLIPLHKALLDMPPLAVNDLNSTHPHINIYPNPAADRIFVDLDDDKSDIILGDMMGQIIMKLDHVGKGRQELDISTLPVGNYLMKVRSGNRYAVEKFSVYR